MQKEKEMNRLKMHQIDPDDLMQFMKDNIRLEVKEDHTQIEIGGDFVPTKTIQLYFKDVLISETCMFV